VATRRDLLCKVHGPSLSVPQVKRQGTRLGAALSCTSGDLLCRNFQQLGEWIHFYYDDQKLGNPPSTRSQFNPSPSLPTSSLLLHRYLTRFDPQTRACILPLQHVEPFTLASGPRGEVSLTAPQPRPFQATSLPRGLIGTEYLIP